MGTQPSGPPINPFPPKDPPPQPAFLVSGGAAASALWLKIRSNKYFVAASSLFFGAVGKEVYTELQTGKWDFSTQSLKAMAASALSATFIALYHLYMMPPDPTMAATIPPSPVVEQVASKLTPVDPTAIPTQEKP
jgi:hypothetical protein